MQLLTDICKETGLSVDDARLILLGVLPEWETCTEVDDHHANMIRQSVQAALPEGNGEIIPVTGMDINHQQQLIDNASQVLGMPLVLAASQEIRMAIALEEVKNAVILASIDQKSVELEIAVKQRADKRSAGYLTAIQDLASQLEKPVSVVESMVADVERNNAQLEEILTAVRSGK
ncbi:MAG: hypothetical protein SAK29_31875 [Scytonema sp. PMC 1069.18]|nr:hypothetical protein [Scytonema sp. PMC 1069.18]MEC4884351.1 hypothetical protein [Scytonema sp. PMC 1070.18]